MMTLFGSDSFHAGPNQQLANGGDVDICISYIIHHSYLGMTS